MKIDDDKPKISSGYRERPNRDKIGNVLQILKFLSRYDLCLTETGEGTLVIFDNDINDVLRIDSYEGEFIREKLGIGEFII